MHGPRSSTYPTQLNYSDLVDPTPCLASSSVRPIGKATMSSVERLGPDRWPARWRAQAAGREHPEQACLPPVGVDSAIEGGTPGRRRLGLRPTQLRSVSGDRAIRASSVLAAAGPRGEVQPDPPEPSYWRTPPEGPNSREEVRGPSGSECSGPGVRRLPSRRLAAVVLRSPLGRDGGAEGQPGRSASASTERCRGCQRGSRQADLGNTKVSSDEVGADPWLPSLSPGR
jgi:hypothetical protein